MVRWSKTLHLQDDGNTSSSASGSDSESTASDSDSAAASERDNAEASKQMAGGDDGQDEEEVHGAAGSWASCWLEMSLLTVQYNATLLL